MISEKVVIEVDQQQAELTCYFWVPSPEYANQENRKCILILPGGGYAMLSDREAEPIAFQYLAEGYNAAVLRYSVSPAIFPTSLLQAAKAVVYLREKHEKYQIDPDGIIVQGFSAGGHLAASLGILWKQDFIKNRLQVNSEMFKPNGEILCYPVITSGEFAHRDSFENLLGRTYDRLVDRVSLEKLNLTDMPKTFIWHTFEDDLVPVENSLLFAQALRKYHINTEFHMYAKGVHGLSLANRITEAKEGFGIQEECQSWITLAKTWIKNL